MTRESEREREKLRPVHCSLQTFAGSAFGGEECVLSYSEAALDTEEYLC